VKKLLIAVLIAVAALGALCKPVVAQEGAAKVEQRRLFKKGAKLWPLYCNTCHNARPPGEKAPYVWDHEIMHMRMLGNIPADDARALLVYLKAR
jgi:cytochrome c5